MLLLNKVRFHFEAQRRKMKRKEVQKRFSVHWHARREILEGNLERSDQRRQVPDMRMKWKE